MNILVIDDEQAIRDSLTMFLEELGHKVQCAENGKAGLELFNTNDFQLVFSDITMPGMDGFEFLRQAKESKRHVDIVIITGNNSVDSAITALREGAYDYLQKPVNIAELSVVIDRVSEHLSLKHDNEILTKHFEETVRERVTETESELARIKSAFRENVGLEKLSVHSEKLKAVFDLADKFHSSPTVPVLIEGETGTGKELLARYVHYGQENSTSPFIAINCGAIPADLFESELFGHESGAFTGASATAKKGQFEIAENGTLLLDEIGDMPLAMQVKLLRVLEEREFYRIGGVKRLSFKGRFMASTNKSLSKEVEEGRFRRDLYHRLNVGYIKIPPLRERPEEIIPLASDFMLRACERHGRKLFEGFEPEAEKLLKSLSWEGNVRQLENAIERVVLIFDGPMIKASYFDFLKGEQMETTVSARDASSAPVSGDVSALIPEEGIDLDELIMRLIEQAMDMAGGNKATAAKLLNISPRTISRRLEKLKDDD